MDLQAAAAHFKMTPEEMANFTQRYAEDINRDDIHVIQIQGRWAFDGTAIKIIEDIKKSEQTQKIKKAAITEAGSLPEVLPLNNDLQEKLTATLAEMTRTALALVDAERRNSAQQVEIGALKERTKLQAEQIAKLEESEKKLKKQAMEAVQYQADLKAERATLQEKINRMRSLPWWKRIFSPDV